MGTEWSGLLDQSSTKFSNPKRKESHSMLARSMDRLQVELQGLQFLLSQEIIMGQSQASVIQFEMESLTKEIQHLGTTRRRTD